MRGLGVALVVLCALVILTAPALARNVDLVTLPGRETVQLTIYNSEDITLVKETRFVTLKKGMNQLQFSWANTLIDPSSVEFRPLDHADEVEVLHTVFPGQKPQHLVWHIESKFEGQVKVEVSYFTSGLTWTMDYVGVTDPGETAMAFDGFVRIFNRSGEEYEDAEIRLIVGTINLVEKIADLARRRGIPTPKPKDAPYTRMRREVLKKSLASAGGKYSDAVNGKLRAGERQIVKEGLSEYFMFGIEGAETVRNGWSKRMRAVKAEGVTFDIVYRMRAYQYGPRPQRFFIWRNDPEHKLGDSPLPDGRVRLFRDNGRDGLSFLAEQQVRYAPVKAEVEINLGPDDLVVYETRRMSTARRAFHYQWVNRRELVDGWDEETRWIDTVRNYRTKPITFELRRQWNGHVDYASEMKTTLFDYRTIQAAFTVPARGKVEYPCTVLIHNGVNSKQNRITLK